MTDRQQNVPRAGAISLAVLLVLTGCGPRADAPGPADGNPVVFSKMVPSDGAVVSRVTETLTPRDLNAVLQGQPGGAYVLGPNDVVAVDVYRHPELSVPSLSQSGNIQGALVTGDGTITVPLAGVVQVAGLTAAQAAQAIELGLSKDLRSPQVNVQIVRPESLRYYLLGSFTQPGIKYPEHELSLLEALSLGGSVDIPHADLYQAYVAQGQTKLPVDLNALLVGGDMSQNIQLASGDTIVIPSSETENGFVFGAVSKPGAVPFESGALSLLQALSAAGMDLPTYTDARLAGVRVIRPHGNAAEFYVVDARSMLSGETAPFALVPGDIVFVPPTALATWNQVLAQILPSLQTVGAALNPFVSIKYLDGH